VGSLDPSEAPRTVALSAKNAAYANGMLLVVRDDALRAQKFDATKMKTEGDSVSIAPVQGFGWNSSAYYGPSQNGLLVYQPQGSIELSQLTRKDRTGKTIATSDPAYYWSPRLSHDATKIAVDKSNEMTGDGDIWIVATEGQTSTRLSFDALNETGPIWSHDDSGVTYVFNETRVLGSPMHKRLAGGGAAPLLPKAPGSRMPADYSSDGSLVSLVTFSEANGSGRDVIVHSLRDGKSTPVATTAADESGAQFSPDMHWIAYQSNETGRDEIYVQPYPPTGAKFQVSAAGGRTPRWPTQKEIFYLSPDDKLTTVAVEVAAGQFRSGAPQALFPVNLRDGGFFPQYDVSADGTLILNELIPHQATPMTLLVSWTRRIARAK
jgi:hypothetical protein